MNVPRADDSTPAALPPELASHPRYRILRELGRGGMGVVYHAEQTLMRRQVAIKVISKALLDRPDTLERFRREVQTAARLAHPNIVAAYDAEQAGDLHMLVMEFVEGQTLAQLLRKRGPLPLLHACVYARQAALGLQHAHEQGTVHRDIKPHNLMLTPKGQVKILDFGLAKLVSENRPGQALTALHAYMGTPEYSAPEQASDARSADIRADIYSLGCTLYCLLAGRPPFQEQTEVQTILAHLERPPPPLPELRPDVPAELWAVLARMLAKAPGQRYQTPAEVAQALAPFCKPGAKATPAPPTVPPAAASPGRETMAARTTSRSAGMTQAAPPGEGEPDPDVIVVAGRRHADPDADVFVVARRRPTTEAGAAPFGWRWWLAAGALVVFAAVVTTAFLVLGGWLLSEGIIPPKTARDTVKAGVSSRVSAPLPPGNLPGTGPHATLGPPDEAARRGRWDEAAASFAEARRQGQLAGQDWQRYALVCLRQGDQAGYQSICQQLLNAAGPNPAPGVANDVAWVCALGPDAADDFTGPLHLAETAAASAAPQAKHNILNTLGAVLYRAGRYQEAIDRLKEGMAWNQGQGMVQDWVFLAMACHRLGRAAEAKEWLARAQAAPAPAGPDPFWPGIEEEMLRREAEALLGR